MPDISPVATSLSVMSGNNRTRAILVSMATLVLVGTNPDSWAQTTGDELDIRCSAAIIGSVVGQTAQTAWCSGYLGQYCSGIHADACHEGAAVRARRGETGGAQGNPSEAQEMEKNRRLVEQLPRLPPEGNPLIGRWRSVSDASPGALLTCLLIAGDGPYFEFRADALVHGARVVDSMRYYRGNEGVFFALGERYLRLLAFELDGLNRMTNGACSFERVGAAASAPSVAVPEPATLASSPSPPSQRQAKVWPPVAPESHLGRGIALHRQLDFQPALKEFIAATMENGNDARAFAFLGDTYRWLGMNDESAAAIDRALLLDPDALDALR